MNIFNPIKGQLDLKVIKWIFDKVWNLFVGNKEFEFACHCEDLFSIISGGSWFNCKKTYYY